MPYQPYFGNDLQALIAIKSSVFLRLRPRYTEKSPQWVDTELREPRMGDKRQPCRVGFSPTSVISDRTRPIRRASVAAGGEQKPTLRAAEAPDDALRGSRTSAAFAHQTQFLFDDGS